jgi:Cu/Ag efflux protein CusF
MPGMTMAFRVADPTMLDAVKAGDAVRVSIDKVKGQLTIVRMQSVR